MRHWIYKVSSVIKNLIWLINYLLGVFVLTLLLFHISDLMCVADPLVSKEEFLRETNVSPSPLLCGFNVVPPKDGDSSLQGLPNSNLN